MMGWITMNMLTTSFAGFAPMWQAQMPTWGRMASAQQLFGFADPTDRCDFSEAFLGGDSEAPAEQPERMLFADNDPLRGLAPGTKGTRAGVDFTVDEHGIPRYDDPGPFVPSAGQWGEYTKPVGDGFWGTRDGKNYVNGHLFAAQGLDTGGIDFKNWLAFHKPMWDAQHGH